MVVPTHRIEYIPPSEKLDKLLAVAQLKAEVAKADIEARDVDLGVAEELFNKQSIGMGMPPKGSVRALVLQVA